MSEGVNFVHNALMASNARDRSVSAPPGKKRPRAYGARHGDRGGLVQIQRRLHVFDGMHPVAECHTITLSTGVTNTGSIALRAAGGATQDRAGYYDYITPP